MNKSEAMLSLVEEGNFIRRITANMVRAALDISGEDPATPNHSRRIALATNVLNDPRGQSEKFVWAASADNSINNTYITSQSVAAIPDGDVAKAVTSVWDAVAGT